MNFVIVGNGAAGIAAAEAIRKLDQDSPITILSEEPCHYYSRIRLIDYLAGKVEEDGLLLKRPEWYQSQGIEVRLGERAVAFDQVRRELSCASGARLSYDRLLIAAGAKSFLPPAPGIDQEMVFTLRTLA
ncbi:MAG: FAD-dependent oxidoreductase, partial [Desulfobacteraceae bacterium]|nr:FAD-dependent oxidoreductase [Desulfobacteraceae bacterium]